MKATQTQTYKREVGSFVERMELDERYTDVIIKRWEDYTGNKAEKVV